MLSDRRVLALMVLCLMLLSSLGLAKADVPGVKTPAISLEPHEKIDPALVAGTRFNLAVNAYNVVDLASWLIKIKFNSSGLGADTPPAELGPYWANLASQGKALVTLTSIPGEPGTTIIIVGVVLVSGAPTFTGPEIALAFPRFSVGSAGHRTVLHLFDTRLANSQRVGIMHDVLDGFFSNISGDNAPPQPSFIWSPAPASAGQPVKFHGNASRDPEPTDTITSYIWDFGDGTTNSTSQKTIPHKYAAAGNYTVKLKLNATGGQTTPALGVRENLVRITAPDVAVTGLTVSRNFAYAGVVSQPIKVNVTVANQGLSSETFTVTARASANIIGSQTVTLAAGATMVVPFNWDAHLLTRGTYTLSAEASAVPGEADLADNLLTDGGFTVRLKGDVNNDCTVNILDLVTIGGNFLKPASAKPEADINNDGVINILDLVVVGSNMFVSCP